MIAVIDTNILIDIFLLSRPRHEDGAQLGRLLMSNGFDVRVPMHALFEITSALKNEKLNKPSFNPIPYNKEYTSDSGFRINAIAIDESFVNKYLDVDLPYLKGKDFIFLCMAKNDKAILITEDNNLYNAAKAADVCVYRIKDFLKMFK